MAATPLTAQECYLLERYTSLEYYARMRDTWEATVHYVDDLLEHYMQHLPDGYRKRPLPKQPDIVWGQRVLPNFRDTLQELYDNYIRLSHGDWSAWDGERVGNDFRGQGEFWPGWMDEVEEGAIEKYIDLIVQAKFLARRISATGHAGWIMGTLSQNYQSTPLDPWLPPSSWQRYRLDPDIQIATGEPILHPGLYWPKAHDAAVQFLLPSNEGKPWTMAPEARVGLSENGVQYQHKEPTVWIKIERVPGETVSDGLADQLAGQDTRPDRVPAGQPCPRTGWWFTPAKASSQRYFKTGDIFPAIEASAYGDTYWQWSTTQGPPSL